MPDLTPVEPILDDMAEENIKSILAYCKTQPGGGVLGISFDPEMGDPETGGEWIISCEFGQEAPDSPMRGGASYSSHPDLNTALFEVATEMGVAVD